MFTQLIAPTTAVDRFFRLLETSLLDGQFVKLLLSKPSGDDTGLERLTVREVVGPQPRRLVLDSSLRLPDAARLLEGAEGLWVFGAQGRAQARDQQRLEAHGAQVMCVAPTPDGRVSLQAVMAALAARGIRRLLVEGGTAVLTSFLRERLADAAEIDIAPCFLGAPAVPGLADMGIANTQRAIALNDMRVDRLGPNLLLRGTIAYANP